MDFMDLFCIAIFIILTYFSMRFSMQKWLKLACISIYIFFITKFGMIDPHSSTNDQGNFLNFNFCEFFRRFGCSVAKRKHFWGYFCCHKIGKNQNIKIPRDYSLCLLIKIIYASFWVNRTIFQILVAIFL